MKWYYSLTISLIIIALIGGLVYLENKKWEIPAYILIRVKQINKNMTPEILEELRTKIAINFDGLSPPELLYWLGKYLTYANPNLGPLDPLNLRLLQFRGTENRSNPLDILECGVGRCEEFSIVYAAFCKLAGYKVRIVWDYSTGISPAGKPNGDHAWVEVDWAPPEKVSNQTYWCHVEPTDGAIWIKSNSELDSNPYIDNPSMYVKDRLKEVKDAWAIWIDSAERVTDRYQYGE